MPVAAPEPIEKQADELPILENWAIRKAFGVLHEALEAQASQIEALSLEVKHLRGQARKNEMDLGRDESLLRASRHVDRADSGRLDVLEERMNGLERILERRTQEDLSHLERQGRAQKELHNRVAHLETRAESRSGASVERIRKIAEAVVEETYSMVGEAKMNALEESIALLARRIGVTEEELLERPTISKVEHGFEELACELKTKADTVSVERELNVVSKRYERMESTTSALRKDVEAELSGVWDETRNSLAVSRDAIAAAGARFEEAQSKHTSWLSRLEASQRDLVNLAESQAERIKNTTYFREQALEGLRSEMEILRSMVEGSVRRF